MGHWGWEWTCGVAQSCHVTSHHSQAVSGPDGEHWRRTIIIYKSCYLVRDGSGLGIQSQQILTTLWGWYCYPILHRCNLRLQEKSTRPVLSLAHWKTNTTARVPPSGGLWETGKTLNKWYHLLNADYVPAAALSTSQMVFSLHPQNDSTRWLLLKSHFVDRETKAQSSEVCSSRSHS